MKNQSHGFAMRKDRRDLQRLRRLLASLFRVVLLVTALSLYWRWNHDSGVGPGFLRERKLATANATYFVSAFGLSGSAALVTAGLKIMRSRRELRPAKAHRASSAQEIQ